MLSYSVDDCCLSPGVTYTRAKKNARPSPVAGGDEIHASFHASPAMRVCVRVCDGGGVGDSKKNLCYISYFARCTLKSFVLAGGGREVLYGPIAWAVGIGSTRGSAGFDRSSGTICVGWRSGAV